MSLDLLDQLGFERAGRWRLADPGIVCELQRFNDAVGVLYCFVSESKPLYLGKTTQQLQRRMYGYQRPGPTQRTNVRCNALLREHLASGAVAEVLVLPDDGSLTYRGYPVCLAAGLEDSLLSTLSPPWNRLGV
jgi:hypothetical protein